MNFKTDIDYRKQSLRKLLTVVESNEKKIIQALYDDFKKPAFESILSETGFVLSELQHTLKNMERWAKPKKVLPSLLNFPSSDTIYKEPYGKVLIIAPWNYPFQLALCPLMAAVAAGNQVVVKPSELTPQTSKIIAQIIAETFHQEHVTCVEGGADKATELLAQPWDYLFFTGSVAVGKIVAKAAAEHLTPVTLELGGKNPCIIDPSANLPLAAKRIVWGKFFNAGQTCIAPDYLLAHQDIKSELIDLIRKEIIRAYGDNPELSPDFARIINAKNWKRQVALMQDQTILFGGKTTETDFFVAPTLIDEPKLDSPLMQEEIFGPLLPVLSYQNEEDIRMVISRYAKPLAFYVFSNREKFAQKIMASYEFGGGCWNDTMIHFANKRLPFGGVGQSGMGAYHGRLGFDTFSHHKAIVRKANWLDVPIRYAPYHGKEKFLKKILNWFS